VGRLRLFEVLRIQKKRANDKCRSANKDANGKFIEHVSVYTDDDDGTTHTSRSNEPFSDGRVLHITKQNGQWVVDGKSLTEAKSAMVGFYWSPSESMCRDIPGESREASKQTNALPLDRLLAMAGIEGQADSFAYGQLSNSLGTFLKLRTENAIPDGAVVVYRQGDKRLQDLEKPATFRGFGIYLVAEKDVPTYDPGSILFATSSPGVAWSSPADSNYKSGHSTGHLATGTVCHLIYGVQDFLGVNGKSIWPLWAPIRPDGYLEAQCFENGKFIDNPSLRVIDIRSPGLVYLKDAKQWVESRDPSAAESPRSSTLPGSSTPALKPTTRIPRSVNATETWTDNRFGSKWTTTDNGEDVSFEEAKRYCSSLPNTEQAKTWHLPKTIVGVSWIVDYAVKPVHVRPEIHLDSCCVWVAGGFQGEIPQIFDFTKGSIVQEHAPSEATARALCINEVGK